MKDCPTTKYEQHHEAIWERHKDGRRFLMLGEVADLLNDLERRLAAQTECLNQIANTVMTIEQIDKLVEETLTLTAKP